VADRVVRAQSIPYEKMCVAKRTIDEAENSCRVRTHLNEGYLYRVTVCNRVENDAVVPQGQS
jgi:hypothetical protein